jgi:ribosomal protein S27AE
VAVQRRLLEIRPELPALFTVVYRSPHEDNPARGTSDDLGRRYAVCPSCGARLPLFHETPQLTCGICHHRGEVAYWETG